MLNSVFGGVKRLFLLLVVMFSPASFAIGHQVLAQSPEHLTLAAYGLAGLLGVLLLVALILKIRLSSLNKKLHKQQQQLDDNIAFLDSFSEASVQLNQAAEVVLVNQSACYFLGKKSSDIIGKPIAGFFDAELSEFIQQQLQEGKTASRQFLSRNRQLLVSVKFSNAFPAHISALVNMQDVTNYQLKIDQHQAEINHYQAVVNNSQLAQLSINLESKTYRGDAIMAAMLQCEPQRLQGELAKLADWVEKSEAYQFNQQLEALKQQGSLIFSHHFNHPDGKLLVRLSGMVSQRNSKGEPLELHLLLQEQQELAKAQQRTQISENLAKAVMTSGHHAIYLLDDEGNMQNCNSTFENLFKTSLTKIKASNVSQLDFFPEEIKNLHLTKAADFGAARFGHDKEFTLTTFEGKTRHLRLSLKYYGDQQGERAGMVGMLEDISELKQTKLSLEQERQRFSALLNLAPFSIATIDANDQIIKANSKMTSRLGMSEKELAKSTLYQLFGDPSLSAKAAKQLHQSGSLHNFKVSLKGNNGKELASELHIDLFDKEQQQYLCWIADISAEQRQKELFENLLQHSTEPMAVLSDKGFSRLNTAACEFFMAEDEQDLFGFTPYAPGLNKDSQSADELAAQIDEVKNAGQVKSILWEHQVNEQILPCQLTLVPIFDDQQCTAVLCIWKDFRAVKEAERARLEAINLHQAAERQVAEKQRLLESSQDLLANKVKSLQDTQSQLQAAQEDISEQQSKISDLQQAHQDVTAHLQKLQQDYKQSRQQLAESESINAELESQLEKSVSKVKGLQEQRNQIADALQYSERKYVAVQNELAQSEKVTQSLQREQQAQQQKMAEFVAQIDNLKQSIEQKDKQINDVSGQIHTLQSQLSSSDRTTEKLRELLANQRKASEAAELQRRELELTCHTAQSELTSKARHIEHLQHEMQKFEEMANQQQGNMQQQHELLKQELEAKQKLLSETQLILDETQKASAKEKAEKEQQQQILQKLQDELAEMERNSATSKQQMEQANQQWLAQQAQLQAELLEKQQKLQQTEQVLNESKQQTAAEKEEKARQQEIFSQLQRELSVLKERQSEQQQQMAQSDQAWQEQQLALKKEAEAKQLELQETQRKLDEKQRIADMEKRERIEQQHKLEQLTIELADVEKRAIKQKEMMEGSDEQRRQFLAEIEQQKNQLQQALQEAEQQNAQMKAKLEGNLVELQKAETQVTQTQSTEQKLLEELNQARRQADELHQRIQQQEQQELALQRQLAEQQSLLQGREQNISELQSKQQALTAELQAVQQEYSNSKKSLDDQDSNQSELAKQLAQLEQELVNSKTQLQSKEAALQQAQQQFESSQAKLAEQEQALVAAHKVELQQAQAEEAANTTKPVPEFASLPLPANPEAWFDLLPFLQKQSGGGPLPVALNALMEELENRVAETDQAMAAEDLSGIKRCVNTLLALANKVNSVALIDQVTRLEMQCSQGLIDNITIAWPSVKKSLKTTLRVIYSHLHA